jgi:scavenger receptor class B, member 1
MSVFIYFSTLTKALNSPPILNITVYDYLWGYEDQLVRLASNIVPSFITFDKLGLLDRVRKYELFEL